MTVPVTFPYNMFGATDGSNPTSIQGAIDQGNNGSVDGDTQFSQLIAASTFSYFHPSYKDLDILLLQVLFVVTVLVFIILIKLLLDLLMLTLYGQIPQEPLSLPLGGIQMVHIGDIGLVPNLQQLHYVLVATQFDIDII